MLSAALVWYPAPTVLEPLGDVQVVTTIQDEIIFLGQGWAAMRRGEDGQRIGFDLPSEAQRFEHACKRRVQIAIDLDGRLGINLIADVQNQTAGRTGRETEKSDGQHQQEPGQLAGYPPPSATC
jgi:hypothetical protein